MRFLMNWHHFAIAVAALLPLTIGCGSGSAPTNSASNSEPSTVAQQTKPITQPQNALPTQVTVVDGAGTAPAQSVAVFLDSLRRGDEMAANAMLTSKAREELAKISFVIQPLGTPDGKYQIGRVGFPYAEKNVALVECVWQEPSVGSTPAVSMDIVCEVHEEAEGWRISGIGITEEGSVDTVVLDFENGASVERVLLQAEAGQSAPNPEAGVQASNVVQQPNQELGNQQLPALPSFPSQGADIPQTQIALPPNTSGNVIR